MLTINANTVDNESYAIELLSVLGQRLNKRKAKANEKMEVNLEGYPTGTYPVKPRFDEGSVVTKKVIKK